MFRRYSLRMTEGKIMRWSIAGKVPPLPLVYAEIRRGGPAGRTCLVRSGPLTPYLIETIAEDVRAAGHPSHVEVRLAPDGDTALLASVREAIARLEERAVQRRRGRGASSPGSTRRPTAA